jgi:hypothetical protein
MRHNAIKSPRVLQSQSNFCVSVMRLFWDQFCALLGHDAMPYQGFWGICYLHIQGRNTFFCSEEGGSRFLSNVGSYSLYDVTTRIPKSWYSRSREHQISQDSYTLLNVLMYWLGSSFDAGGTWLKSHSGNLPSRYSSVRPTRYVMLTNVWSVTSTIGVVFRVRFTRSTSLSALVFFSPAISAFCCVNHLGTTWQGHALS